MNFGYSFIPDINKEYNVEQGYGFAMPKMRPMVEDMKDSWRGDYFIPITPSLLMDVPNGNYEVKITIGSPRSLAEVAVKEGLG